MRNNISVGFIVMVSTLLGCLPDFALAADADKPKTMSVNGYTVDEREYKREYSRYRSAIMIKYAQQFTDRTKFSEFWETPVNGISPSQNLNDTVLYALKRLKIQEELLQKNGLWNYTDYEQFLQDIELTNQNRKKAVAEGKVIYGPVEYSERAFYDYKFSNALIRLKKMIDGKEIVYSEADLSGYFKEKVLPRGIFKESDFERMKNQVKEWLIEDRYKLLIDSLSQIKKDSVN